ncbi:MAG: 6-phosphogluconolactonase [Aeromicrobium sp.]|uniref:6-phosphogluconolactonase n=1 Tax=Aeromicrobium sp. TaxID=1871063 RepID=UPI0039E5D3F4
MIVTDDPAGTLAAALTERIAAVQAGGNVARIALTGGTIAAEAYRRLGPGKADWSRVKFWWSDERFVPEGHADRNAVQAREAFLDRLAVPPEHIHPMPAHGCDRSMADAADDYATSLPEGGFDVMLLGLGPDGHVASLFPGFAQLTETRRRVVEVFGSPKPPPERITLTYPALNDADAVWLVASGEGKAEAVARALATEGSVAETPARGVQGRAETRWFLDPAAASKADLTGP